MPTTTTYTSNGTFHVTASSVAVNISAWGAGGNGSANGTGGSGGAYAAKSVTLPTGSYSVTVGQPNSDGRGNGGNSTFVSASIILVRAAGGKSDGTIAHQAALNTGSTKYVGGAGGTFTATGYGNYGGAGGGSAAGGLGAGVAGSNGYDSGASFPAYGHPLTGSVGASGGASGGGNGGNASYYDAGTNSRLIPATAGDAPGGGGGGGYSGETNTTVITEGSGGVGRVTVTF